MQKFSAEFRFYEELNDFLPGYRKKQSFPYAFSGKPAIKDAIEACGIPHPEVELIMVNGKSVSFDYHLQNGDRVAVYPMFESIDVTSIIRLREKPLRETRFILDVHLGKLARYLRLCGFDTGWEPINDDHQIVAISTQQKRIILTRDQGLLKHRQVSHGYWVRNTLPAGQLQEVLGRFDLYGQVKPFTRCMVCNGSLHGVSKEQIIAQLQINTIKYFDTFQQCTNCKKVYWPGTHHQRMERMLTGILRQDG
ncbi:MAG: twitching motility protein PilT [Calditrichales bacterium]|nr:MAG: twitching motility protein PilT [Calditrichales bacterium]